MNYCLIKNLLIDLQETYDLESWLRSAKLAVPQQKSAQKAKAANSTPEF